MRSPLWLASLPFRLAGTLLVVAGFAAGVWDLYLSVEREQIMLTSLGETLAIVSHDLSGLLPASGTATQASPEPDTTATPLEPVPTAALAFFLGLPSFLALLILATLSLLVAQLIYRPR